MNLEKRTNSIAKLISTVSATIGVKYDNIINVPKKSIADYNSEKIDELNSHGIIVAEGYQSEFLEKIKQRWIHQEVSRQINLDNIIEKAAENLENKEVSEIPVDEDWRGKYFSKAQEISNKEMQNIWANILSQEVTTPGSVSLRTLEIISNLTKLEAETFEKAASMSFNGGHILKLQGNAFDEFNLKFDDLLLLRSANLIFDSDTLNITFTHIPQMGCGIMIFHNNFYKVSNPNSEKYTFNQVAMTPAGKELMSVIKVNPNMDYLQKFQEEQIKKGYTFEKLIIETR